MKNILVFILCMTGSYAYTQITSPDTLCLGASASFTSTRPAVTYHWDLNSVNIIQPFSPTTLLSTGHSVPSWTCFMKDGSNYYCFVSGYSSGIITRLDYGTSIYSTPTSTSLGTFGATGGNTECLDIVKDSVSGNWFGLLVNNTQLVVLSFGASLSNTPTSTVTTYPQILWAHQITIKRYGGNWHAFVANRNSCITRFDFGSALTNPPVITNLPNVGGVANPCNFTLYEQAGSWYMIITNLINATVTRYSFGTNLLNNAPTGTLLTAPVGMLNLPRPVFILNDCHNHLVAYVVNETGNIIKMDFLGDITNAPVFSNMGPSGVTTVPSGSTCAYNDSFYYLLPSYSTGRIYKFRPLDFTAPAYLSYFIPPISYTYPATGTYDVSLFFDMGRPSGPSVSCKQITIVDVAPITGTTTLCVGNTTTLSNTTPGGVWSSGTPGVATIGSGTGIVTGVAAGTSVITYSVGGCSVYITVSVSAIAPITGTLVMCPGGTTTLSNPMSGGTWSSGSPGIATVGSSTGIVTGVSSGTAVITYTAGGGCYTTVVVTISPIGPITGATTICVGGTSALGNSVPGGTWTSSNTGVATIGASTGIVTGIATGTSIISYVAPSGCSTSVTVSVVSSSPIGGTPIVCVGSNTLLTNPVLGGTWSSSAPGIATISSTGMVTGIAVGTAVITYTAGLCSSTIIVTVSPVPSVITGLTNICVAATSTLSSTTPGGVWTSNNTAVATIGLSTGVLTGVSTGTATITYTISAGCFVTTIVTINTLISTISGPSSLCVGGTIVLSNSVSGGTWSSGNPGVASIGGYSGIVDGIAAGSASITYLLIGGCRNITTINVNPIPLAPVTTDIEICQYITPVPALTATGSGLTWYTASTGGSSLTVAPVPSATIPGVFTWYVSQVINGCEGPRAPISVIVHPRPAFDITASKPIVCKYDTIHFAYSGGGLSGAIYEWSIPPYSSVVTGTLSDPSVTVKFDTSIAYNMVTLTVGDGYKPCNVIDTYYVKIDINLPEAHFYIKPDICLGDSIDVALTWRSDGIKDYIWDFDGGNVITASSNHGGPYRIVWNTLGRHIVMVKSITNEVCPAYIARDTFEIHKPDAHISPILGDICAGDDVLFSPAKYSYANQYTWTPEHYFHNNNSNSIYGRIEKTDIITLTVMDPFGCISTDRLLVKTKPCCVVTLPNAFTPNNDGKNDIFRPITDGHHKIHIFRVMNRWGQTVFESAEEKNGWDGVYNGIPQDLGTFYYYLKYDCAGESIELKGDVELIR